jgi:hypothetical protein
MRTGPTGATAVWTIAYIGSRRQTEIAVTDVKLSSSCGLTRALMKGVRLVVGAVLLIGSTPFAAAQAPIVNRSINGRPDTDIQIGVYLNVKPDCTSGPLPSIQLISAPENGKVTVRQGRVTATNQSQCLAVEIPAFVAFYHSRADFSGVDVVTLQIRYVGGKTELQKITVIIGTGTPGQGL